MVIDTIYTLVFLIFSFLLYLIIKPVIRGIDEKIKKN